MKEELDYMNENDDSTVEMNDDSTFEMNDDWAFEMNDEYISWISKF